jgi:hypothetical protein
MIKLLPALVFAIVATGCFVREVPVANNGSSSSPSERCPPGHRWHDGRCHETGKGHDREDDQGHDHDRGHDRDHDKREK